MEVKQHYVEPQITVVNADAEDVIVTSIWGFTGRDHEFDVPSKTSIYDE